MTQEQFSIVFFALLVGGALWFRRWYHSQPRTYKVSEQVSAGRMLAVTEINPRWETAAIELKVVSREALENIQAFVEFVSSKGETQRLSLKDLDIDDVVEQFSQDRRQCSITFEKRDLMRGIRNREIKPYRFRFVVADGEGTLIKSHLFGFSSKYMLFRPDTGKYN